MAEEAVSPAAQEHIDAAGTDGETGPAGAEGAGAGTEGAGAGASETGTVQPVSYTHLDVYKRQRYMKPIWSCPAGASSPTHGVMSAALTGKRDCLS